MTLTHPAQAALQPFPRFPTLSFPFPRYADVLSSVYLGYALLWYSKKYPVEGDAVVLDHALRQVSHEAEKAFFGIFRNFPIRPVGWVMRMLTFPFGEGAYRPPDDSLIGATARQITTETGVRNRLSETVFVSSDPSDRVRQINDALPKCIAADKILSVCRKQKRNPTAEEQLALDEAEAMREKIIQVDAFKQLVHPHEDLVRGTQPDDPADASAGSSRGRRLQRVASFEDPELEPEQHSILRSGSDCHNDPHAPRGKDTSSALGW
jgi:acyl-CoA dehydrogenase